MKTMFSAHPWTSEKTDKSVMAYDIRDKNARDIGMVWKTSDMSKEELMENVRLITNAPELLIRAIKLIDASQQNMPKELVTQAAQELIDCVNVIIGKE